MKLTDEQLSDLHHIIRTAGRENIKQEDYNRICEHFRVSKFYFDVDMGEALRTRDSHPMIPPVEEKRDGDRIVLYDDGSQTGLRLKYTYFFEEKEYVHSYLEFRIGIRKEDLDLEALQFFSDVMHVLMSRKNMKRMLDISRNSDALTGIPNIVHIQKKYKDVTREIPGSEFVVIRLNLQNFKYVNDVGGARAGDEAIIQYSRKLCEFVEEDEGVCRLGGDNFVLYVHRENLTKIRQKVNSVLISNLKSAPGNNFNISAWMGVAMEDKENKKQFSERLNEASAACELGKGKLKMPIVFYDEELLETISHNRNIISMFRPAIQKREFMPFFQAKVNMRDGSLVGFEALCRWKHEGRFIYPDEFIPVLDKNSFIPELDMTIFKETCSSIRQWKNMGLNPPVVSSNFSKKNLFVPDIEDKIADVIDDFGLSPDDVEIEITESVKDNEYEQLMSFISKLKERGIRISIDDFGTGYSSLSLIHNIDADAIKIDRSFVDKLPDDKRSRILIESIISIANRLQMSVIAEGVENEKQGRALLEMGCDNAQGYFYSKPVDFEEATRLIEESAFKPM